MVKIFSAVAASLPHLLLYLSHNIYESHAILQTAAIDINVATSGDGSNGDFFTLLASQASFGANPSMSAENNPPMSLQFPPQKDPLLCNEAEGIDDYSQQKQQ